MEYGVGDNLLNATRNDSNASRTYSRLFTVTVTVVVGIDEVLGITEGRQIDPFRSL